LTENIKRGNQGIIVYSNAIGYATSNFIGQLHLQVKVNLTFNHVGNCVRILIWSDKH